jgi:predicted transcriptional regulator
MMRSQPRLTITLTWELKAALERVAQLQERSAAFIARKAIERYLEELAVDDSAKKQS